VRVFLDTSALVAVADEDEERHETATEKWLEMLERSWPLVTHSYVAVELAAVLHRTIGKRAAAVQVSDLLGPVEIRWVTPSLHAEAFAGFRESRRAKVSLVDHVSFTVMRGEEVSTAFAFDDDFRRAGFETIP
jgi:predicted nucleic acid-binding protein